MSVEKKIKATAGWGVLIGVLVAFVIIIAAFVLSIISMATADEAGLPISPLAGWGLASASPRSA